MTSRIDGRLGTNNISVNKNFSQPDFTEFGAKKCAAIVTVVNERKTHPSPIPFLELAIRDNASKVWYRSPYMDYNR
jgi:hypothetical protein